MELARFFETEILGQQTIEGKSELCIISFLITVVFIADGSKEMRLVFLSAEFQIERAKVLFFPADATLRREGEEITLPNGQTISLARGDVELKPLPLVDGSTEVEIAAPGTFMAVLSDLILMRLRDRKEFHVPRFHVRQFTVTGTDLASGAAEIPIPSRQAFRVVTLDEKG